jgi:hypothetical protein
MRPLNVLIAVTACFAYAAPARAQAPRPGGAREAVERALPSIEAALHGFNASKPTSKTFPTCVSCHHEAMGLATLALVRRRGFEVDQDLERDDVRAVREFFDTLSGFLAEAEAAGPDVIHKDGPVGDIASGAGYLLWALIDQGQPGTPAIEAAVRALLKTQQVDGRWSFKMPRVPLQSSDFTTTAMALRVLLRYAPEGRAEEVARSVREARAWLHANRPVTADDLTFQLLGLRWAGESEAEVFRLCGPLLAAQRDDGGWAQLPAPHSPTDAYATGMALFALNQAAGIDVAHPAYRRGVAFLIGTQAEDGTWHVKKRARAVQRYFDADFPYGVDQYISLPGTCWATMALALAATSNR